MVTQSLLIHLKRTKVVQQVGLIKTSLKIWTKMMMLILLRMKIIIEDCNQDKSAESDNLEPASGINDVGHLEISGVTDDGRRVMSVVQNNEDVSQTYLDTYLTWDIPDSWSLEDAATVPLAYATAYHCLIQTALLKSGETVLIHAGHTPVGQAAIAFALHIGSIVFTTVTEIIHKEFLMKRFPQVSQI
ncbi:unnamed protein product, partial [Timema podura]|nr:unnamed protein product [Timema podura]